MKYPGLLLMLREHWLQTLLLEQAEHPGIADEHAGFAAGKNSGESRG